MAHLGPAGLSPGTAAFGIKRALGNAPKVEGSPRQRNRGDYEDPHVCIFHELVFAFRYGLVGPTLQSAEPATLIYIKVSRG